MTMSVFKIAFQVATLGSDWFPTPAAARSCRKPQVEAETLRRSKIPKICPLQSTEKSEGKWSEGGRTQDKMSLTERSQYGHNVHVTVHACLVAKS